MKGRLLDYIQCVLCNDISAGSVIDSDARSKKLDADP